MAESSPAAAAAAAAVPVVGWNQASPPRPLGDGSEGASGAVDASVNSNLGPRTPTAPWPSGTGTVPSARAPTFAAPEPLRPPPASGFAPEPSTLASTAASASPSALAAGVGLDLASLCSPSPAPPPLVPSVSAAVRPILLHNDGPTVDDGGAGNADTGRTLCAAGTLSAGSALGDEERGRRSGP